MHKYQSGVSSLASASLDCWSWMISTSLGASFYFFLKDSLGGGARFRRRLIQLPGCVNSTMQKTRA